MRESQSRPALARHRAATTVPATMLLATAVLAACGQEGDTMSGTPTSGTAATTSGPTGSEATGSADAGSASAATRAASAPVTVEASATPGSPTEPGLDSASQGLAVEYVVRNDGDRPVLVARDRGHGQHTGSFGPKNDEAVWVGVEGEVLRLRKELLPAPDRIDEETETTLGAVQVEPGGSITGTAFVRAPLSVDLPDDAQDGEPVGPEVTQWQLCLSVADADGRQDGRTDVIGRLSADPGTVCTDPAALPDVTGR
ncbi:hypothetical protein BJF80_03190 [Serinicoccus sp. CUA-874]|uniref:hypothetical protein n=1 Tax=Serinicoccus sp. CUA-874 TaxID=1517939 RepID=UPI0009617813|nr:hypothetical protein [Serinicoccus sp. CUA-874]OLT17194.1 hypothetical protein BJF80_03190 [Serinicoccus sp. CUA-874]